jgi:hypothetical protein
VARHALRLRGTLREFFPAASEAFQDLDSREAMELLGRRSRSRSRGSLVEGQDRRGAAAGASAQHHCSCRA